MAHHETADEQETAGRISLNLGHTLGHAIESACGYAGLRHGERLAGIAGLSGYLPLANKTARIVWAMLTNNEDYRAPVAVA